MNRLGKDVLAAYFNDARLNILYCLNDIRSRTLQLKPFENEDQIVAAFRSLDLENRPPEIQRDIIKQLRNRFRFLDVLLNAEPRKKRGLNAKDSVFLPSPANYNHILDFLFQLIQDLRNSMVHPMDEESVISFKNQRRLSIGLTKVYASARITVKQRLDVDTKTIDKILLHQGKKGFKPVQRFSFAICKDPKANQQEISHYHSEVLHDFGYVLLCSLFLDKHQSATLIAKFWEAGHSKFWDTDYQRMIKEMISVYRIWLPLRQIKTDDDKSAVTVDTLTELSSCPRQLVDRLSFDDKEKFRTGEPQAGDNPHNDDSFLMLRGRNNRFVPLMMRYFDFDPSNKLRFAIDLGHYYYNVRFKSGALFPADGQGRERRLGNKMVAYGRLADFDYNNKPTVWKNLEENQSKIGAEIEQLKAEASKDIEQLSPYIVETYPHYHFADDKIGFRIAAKAEDKSAYPELPENIDNEKPELAKGENMLPDFWVSHAQLLQLAFYNYLQKDDVNTSHQSIDILLSKYRAGMKKLLISLDKNDIPIFEATPNSTQRRQQAQQWVNQFFPDDIDVSLADLPKVIVHQLIRADDRKVEKSNVIERLQTILERTKAKRDYTQRRLQSDVKPGKKSYRAIKCGDMADFLTDDILRFQPIDQSKIEADGGKLNSQEYQILQSTLAYYGAHIDKPPRIVDLLTEFGLLSGEFKHPFLDKLQLQDRPEKYLSILSFYDAYLQARQNFVSDYIKKIKQQIEVMEVPKWLRLRKPSTLDSWLKDYKKDDEIVVQALPVPKHIFYQPLLQMVAKQIDITPQQLEQEGMQTFTRDRDKVKVKVEVKPASTWFIKYYLEQKNDDQVQQMYGEYKRSHRLFDTYFDARTNKQMRQPKESLYLSESERKEKLLVIQGQIKPLPDGNIQKEKYVPLLRNYKRSEKIIRHSATQDMVLYLYARQMLEEKVLKIPTENLKLKNIENTLLNTVFDIELAVPETDRFLFQKDCKIKILGKFRLLLQDRRLKTLFDFYPQNEMTLNADEIRAELKSYQRCRVKIMRLVHQLEKGIVACCGEVPRETAIPEELQSVFRGRHGDYLYALYQQYTKKQGSDLVAFDAQLFAKARDIRNKFSHNQYPNTDDFMDIKEAIAADKIPENFSDNRKVAERLLKQLEEIYASWLNYLANPS